MLPGSSGFFLRTAHSFVRQSLTYVGPGVLAGTLNGNCR